MDRGQGGEQAKTGRALVEGPRESVGPAFAMSAQICVSAQIRVNGSADGGYWVPITEPDMRPCGRLGTCVCGVDFLLHMSAMGVQREGDCAKREKWIVGDERAFCSRQL